MSKNNCKVSLRGTLAMNYMEYLKGKQSLLETRLFLEKILKDDSCLKVSDADGKIIVGKRSEVGKFPPDW